VLDDNSKPYLFAADVRAYSGDGSMLLAPDGSMYCIEREPEWLCSLLARCDGGMTVAELAGDDPTARDILAALNESGCMTFQPPLPGESHWQRFVGDAKTLSIDQIAYTHLILTGDHSLAQRALAFREMHAFASARFVEEADVGMVSGEHVPEQVILLALYRFENTSMLVQFDELCEQRGIRWLSLRFEQHIAWLGPAIIPGCTANYRDLIQRRAMAAEDQALFRAFLTSPLAHQKPYLLAPQPEITWIMALCLSELQRWVAGAPCRLLSAELCVDPLLQQQTLYPILPHPRRILSKPLVTSVKKDIGLLYNSRSGIITDLLELCHHPSIPRVFCTIQARLAQNPDWLNDPLSMWSFCDLARLPEPDATSAAAFQMAYPIELNALPPQALLHAAKYYCDSNFYHAQTRLADYTTLTRSGHYALDPQRLALFSETMYAAPGCPFVPFRHSTPAYWVRGHSLTHDRPTWLPAHLVYVNAQLADFVQEQTPLTQSASYVGLAAGWNVEDALVGAIEDCIRRDTMMIWWFNGIALPSIQIPPELARIWEGTPGDLGQHARLIALPNQFGLPIIAGVLENSVEQLLTIGFGYGGDPIHAACQAWAEAATSQEASRDMNDPNGLTRLSVEQGLMNDAFKAWRADRAYLDEYRTDFRDMTDPLVQRQFYLDPRAIERVRPWIDTPATLTFDDVAPQHDRSLQAYRKRLESQGFEIFWFDLTPPDLALVGLTVVRVIIPGLVPHFPAAFPAVGNKRVQRMAVTLGWRSKPLAEEKLNYLPLPGV